MKPIPAKNKIIIVVLLSMLYWGSRAIYIDSDIPKWKTFYFSQIDEASYAIGAFYLADHPGEAYAAYARQDILPITLFSDAVTALSLSVFGDNYFGLRFPSMLMGYCILIFIFLLFNKKFGITAAVFASAILLFDVGFLLSSRIAEPTIFRLFGMLCIIYFLNKMTEGRPKPAQFFIAGLLSSFAFFFFYPTSFFIVPSAFIFIAVLLLFTKKETPYGVKPWLYYILSSVLCLTVFLVISYYLIGDLSRFSEILNFSDRVASSENNSILSTLKGFASNIKQITSASFFYFNPYFLVIGALALLFFLVSVFRNFWNTRQLGLDEIMWIFLFMFLCQTAFLNDYPRKKLLILFPFVVYSLIYALVYIESKYKQINLVKYSFALIVPVILIQASLQFKYVYSHPTYEYKKTMTALQKYDGKILAGNLSNCFRLYNKYIPILEHYTYYRDHEKYKQVLKELSADKNFAGSIYYAEEKFVQELKEENLCPVDTIMHNNPNTGLKITMNVNCTP